MLTLSPAGPMPAHSMRSATISFGLVSVPIKMFSAGESSAAISFNWLHKKDGARLKQQYGCSKDGEKVEKEDMIKGYEFAKGRYVQFTPDKLKALEEKGTGSINITEFVDADTVDRMYMDKVYFMGPDKGGDRAFTLLGEALKKTRKVEGEEITEEPTEAPKTQIIDLMEARKASLAKGKGSTGGERKPPKRAERAAEAKPAKRRKAASA